MDPSSFYTNQSENKYSFQQDYIESEKKDEEEDFKSNRPQSTEETFERVTEAVKKKGDPLVGRDQDKFQAAREKRAKIIAERRRNYLAGIILQAGTTFQKATDANLQDAAKFIDQSNIHRIATRFLGLTLPQISGMDGFSVLKLWRDAWPFQGSKEVRWIFRSGSRTAFRQRLHGEGASIIL